MYRINLLPEPQKQKVRWEQLLILLLIIAILAGGFFFHLNNMLRSRYLEAKLESLEREREALQPLVQKTRSLQRDIDELEDKIFYDEVFYPRTSMAEVIKEFSRLLPSPMSLDQTSLGKDGELTLSGDTTDHRRVKAYVDRLRGSEFFREVELIESVSSWGEERETSFRIEVIVDMEMEWD